MSFCGCLTTHAARGDGGSPVVSGWYHNNICELLVDALHCPYADKRGTNALNSGVLYEYCRISNNDSYLESYYPHVILLLFDGIRKMRKSFENLYDSLSENLYESLL